MSVITYVYPRDPERLAINDFLLALSDDADFYTVVQCDTASRKIPNWSYLLLSDDRYKHLQFEFVIEKNNKANIKSIAEQYTRNRNLHVVQAANSYVWAKIRTGKARDREIIGGFTSFYAIIWLLARVSRGVVDLPEDEKLYSATGFARHKNKLQADRTAFL